MSYEGAHPFAVKSGGSGLNSTTAYAVICSGTTSTGSLQQVSGLGTSGQILTSQGAGSLPHWTTVTGAAGFSTVNVQVFTANGTYTPTANMKYCIVECVGGGGGGGGAGGSIVAGAGGGGSGAYVRKVFAAATIGASQTVTIGGGGAGGAGAGGGTGSTGGNTTLGALLTANGGVGGVGTGGSPPNIGGSGGTGSGGDLNMTGGSGVNGAESTSAVSTVAMLLSGYGGSSPLGWGGTAKAQAGAAGAVGTGYGAGGSGGNETTSTTRAGGAGIAGIIVITEFI